MKRPQKLTLGNLPTPIQKLETLSARLNKDVYVKRDDFTGLLLSGNKIRKLEFVLQEALDENANAVVTCGGLQSNHVRATVVAARRLGLKPFAVLRGEQPKTFDGNTLIIAMFGAEITYVTEKEYDEIDRVYEDMDKKLRSRGFRPYFIPEGASNALGCWGYISMMEELDRQQKEMNLQFDSLFIPLGSGGTQAGLILGKNLTSNPVTIIGINIFRGRYDFEGCISSICKEAIMRFEIPLEFNKADLHIYNDYTGAGYAQTTDKEMRFFLDFLLDEGIILDHVYTGKACYGMIDLLKRFPDRFGKTILFVHTGGLFGLFPEKERITRLLQST